MNITLQALNTFKVGNEALSIKIMYKAISCATIIIYKEALKEKPQVAYLKVLFLARV
jgi:hypothetical protein